MAEQSSSTLFIAGLDEHKEKVHSAMYYDLWSNGPFEINEFPDYTLIDHFKKPIPSFPPREAILDYLIGKSKYQWGNSNNQSSFLFTFEINHQWCHTILDFFWNSAIFLAQKNVFYFQPNLTKSGIPTP